MKKFFTLFFLLLAGTLLSACAPAAPQPKQASRTLIFKDQRITVSAPPQRIAPLTTSLLTMSDAVGGTPIARPSTINPLPEHLKELPDIGRSHNIDMEKLLGLQPDFVLGEKLHNKNLEPLLQSNHIPHLIIEYGGIDDNVPLMEFLGQLYGTEDKAQQVIHNYQDQMDAVEKEAASRPPLRIAILRATGKDVTAETGRSITASMAKALHMDNVVLHHQALSLDSQTVPYSLEQLAADDPDVIFIVTVGNHPEQAEEALRRAMKDNPAWPALQAVQLGKVFYLPNDQYLLNPGIRTPEAMRHLLDLAYSQEK